MIIRELGCGKVNAR